MTRVPRPPAGDPLEAFTEEEIRTCLRYAKPRQRWSLAALAVQLAVLAVLALTGGGRSAVRLAAGLAGGWAPGRAALAAAAVVVAEALAALPFSLRAWRQDLRAGLSTQRPRGFLADWLKGRAVGLVLTAVPVAALVAAARRRPPGYPWTAALAAAALVVVLSLLGPVVLEPLFNRFVPLPAGPLRDRVLYVSRLGRTRRVVLYDTLAERAGDDEVALVLAHELAHVRHRDVTWGTAAGAAAAAVAVLGAGRLLDLPAARGGFHLTGLGDPLAAPALLLLAAVAGLVTAPLASWVSRWSEARADWVALEVSRDPDTAVAVERRLALDNRADLRPNRLLVAWFSSHPPAMARIAQARLWAAGLGAPRMRRR